MHYSDDQGWFYLNYKFYDPRAEVFVLGRGHISYIVKMHYFFKNLLLYSQALIRQTKYVVMMAKEGSTKSVIWGRGSCARVWPYKSYSENALFL